MNWCKQIILNFLNDQFVNVHILLFSCSAETVAAPDENMDYNLPALENIIEPVESGSQNK